MHRHGQGIVTSLVGGRRPAFFPWALLLRRVMLGMVLTVVFSGGPAHGQIADPSRFQLSIDGFEIGTFVEVSGLTSEVEPTYSEPTETDAFQRPLGYRRRPPEIVLKRGKTAGMEIWAWHQAVLQGGHQVARRNATLTLFDRQNRPVARYFLEKAWPRKIELSALKAGSSEVLFESVTFVCESLQQLGSP